MADNNLRIEILAQLEEVKSEAKIKEQLNSIQKKLNINVGIDTNQINQIGEQLKNLQKQIGKQNKGIKIVDEETLQYMGEIETDINSIINKYKQLGTVRIDKNLDLATREVKEFTLELQKADGIIQKINYEGLKIAKPDGTFEYAFRENSIKEIDTQMKQREQVLQKEQQTRINLIKEEEKEREKAIKEEQRLIQEREKVLNEELKIRKLLESQQEKQRQQELKQRDQSLQYEQKTRKLIDDTIRKEKEKSDQLEHQLQIYKKQAEINVANLRRRYGDSADNESLNKYLKSVNNLTTATPQLKREMDNLNVGFKEISSNVKTSNSHVLSFGEAFKTAMVKGNFAV